MDGRFASVKLPAQLVEDARREADLTTRSIAGQVEHWAKLGRTVERARGATIERVRAAIDGRIDPADLSMTERVYYYDLIDAAIATASPAEEAAAASAGQRPGATGFDGDTLLIVDSAGNVRRATYE